MRRWLALGVACGGGGPTHTLDNVAPGHDPELVIVRTLDARVYVASPRGLQLERDVTLPSTIGELAWVGDKPVAILRAEIYSDEASGDPSLDGQVGRIGSAFEPFPAVKGWIDSAPKPDEASMYAHTADHPAWRMVVTNAGEVWQGRSEWSFVPDAGGPSNWVYARLFPSSPTSTLDAPKSLSEPDVPKITPPANPKADLVTTGPKDEEGTIKPENLLACTDGSATVQLPPEDARTELFNVDDLEWLASDPPIFRVDEIRAGYTAIVMPVTYEGCTPSTRFRSVAVGADGYVAVYGPDELWLVKDGRVIGKVPGGRTVVFKRL